MAKFGFALLSFSVLLLAGYLWNPGLFSGQRDLRGKDDVFYDNLAFNIERGKGFSFDFYDQTWRSFYIEDADPEVVEWIESLQTEGLTASRAPGYPFVVAAIYRIFGHRWHPVYILNWLSLSVGITLLAVFVANRFGWIVGGISLVTLAIDFRIHRMIPQVMTESLATFWNCLVFCIVLSIWEWVSRSDKSDSNENSTDHSFTSRLGLAAVAWAICGMLFGVSILIRPNQWVWLVMIAMATPAIALWLVLNQRKSGTFLAQVVCFVLGSILVVFPWWVRNCQLLDRFEPLGTGGKIGWVGGYCDNALVQNGNWDLATVLSVQRQAFEVYPIRGKPLPEKEFYMGKLSRDLGDQWLSENLESLPKLVIGKALSHLSLIQQPYSIIHWLNGLLLLGALIGVIAYWRPFGFWFAIILMLSIATAMLTWSHYGRYMIPVRPMLHFASAMGTVYLWKWIFRSLSRKRPTPLAKS